MLRGIQLLEESRLPLSDVGDGIFECESSCKANGSVAYGTRKIGKQYIETWIEWNTRQDAIAELRLVGCFSLKG